MFSTLRNRFGIPGVISVIALVFAMIGGAYAASNSGDGRDVTASAKKMAKKAKRGPRGPKGATGPVGPSGAAGPKGDKGDAGSNGQNGNDGNNGNDGDDGKSVTTGTALPSECPIVGGATVEVEGVPASKKAVCNGKEGSPWTDLGVLPEGETLTGIWSTTAPRVATVNFTNETFENTAKGQQMTYVFSIPIPLASEPEPIYVGAAASAPGCPGLVDGTPTADPGKLCVYTGTEQGDTSTAFFFKPISFPPPLGASRAGTVAQFTCEQNVCTKIGTWAVTAPEA